MAVDVAVVEVFYFRWKSPLRLDENQNQLT
jgi:hypothetical protein